MILRRGRRAARLLALAGVCFGAAAGEAEEPAASIGEIRSRDVLAIVTYAAGEVSVKERGSRRRQPALTLQGVTDGASLRLAKGAELTLLCNDGGVIEVVESGALTRRRCRRTRRRVPGRFDVLIPDGGRLKAWAGSWTLEGETRDGKTDYGLRPVLLAPRCPLEEAHRLGCSRLLRTPATIRWVPVPAADRYHLRLSRFNQVVVPEGELACNEKSDGAPYQVCSVPWPTEWRLDAGAKYFLQIEARIGLFDRTTSEKTKFELLPGEEAAAIQRELAAITKLGLDSGTGRLLASAFQGERGLANESLAVLEVAIGDRPAAVLRVALGDAYSRVDLLYPALHQYQQALAELDTNPVLPAVRAAVELGLGRVYGGWGIRDQALAHLGRARALYQSLGLEMDARSAEKMIGKLSN